MRRYLGPPNDRLYVQPPCAACRIARFTATDRDIGPFCASCGWPHREDPMARTMRSTTTLDETGHEKELEPRRRGRPTKHPMAMGNVTDDTIEEFGNKALTAKQEAEKNGRGQEPRRAVPRCPQVGQGCRGRSRRRALVD